MTFKQKIDTFGLCFWITFKLAENKKQADIHNNVNFGRDLLICYLF